MTAQHPLRDRQTDAPWYLCANCGQEHYIWDSPPQAGLCPLCQEFTHKRKEDAMTLQEMSLEYRSTAQVLKERIETLKAARQQSRSPAEQTVLSSRIHALGEILQETRILAYHLEHYYEGGFRRDGRYTV